MIRLPALRGVIDRRILVNFRVTPAALRAVLPAPFRPKLVGGMGIAGVCLIRLSEIRPPLVPRALGLRSENAAHRIAVEWDDGGTVREGVYIPRRDTSSRFNVAVGGRIFPGEHHPAAFTVEESDERLSVALRSTDGLTRVAVEGRVAAALPAASLFATLGEASRFFEGGALGYSATARPGVYDGLELRSFGWALEPLEVTRVESTFFADPALFPPGSVAFDCALLMRRIAHEWHAQPRLEVTPASRS
jgi:hypothetical protein